MTREEIEQAVRDYNWMIKEIKRQRELLSEIGNNITSKGGIESSLPKPKGTISDPVAMEVIRRDQASRWVRKLEKKVLFIQQHLHVITDQKERAVLECMLDGLSMAAIGKHMGLSRRHVYNIKESIVDKIAHFAHISQKSTNEKRCG